LGLFLYNKKKNKKIIEKSLVLLKITSQLKCK